MTHMIDEIRTHLDARSLDALKAWLRDVNLYELVEAFEGLTPAERVVVFRLLEKDKALDVFESMELWLQGQLLEGFAEQSAIDMLSHLPADDRVRLLDELPAKVAKRLTAALPRNVRSETFVLLGYESETVGRMMNPHFFSLRKTETVAEALERVRWKSQDFETPYILFVTDDSKKLEGLIMLNDLVSAEAQTKLADVMEPEVISVFTWDDQEDAARLLQERDLIALPVVDAEHRLVGVLTVDDAMDILEAETTEDFFERAGLVRFQETEKTRSHHLVEGRLSKILMSRLPYLLITLAGGMLAGAVIDGFEAVLEAIAVVAIFIPVIMDMGGNVGTQSSTIFTRAFVLGQINMGQFRRHWFKEIRNGATMGIVLGLIGGWIAALWQGLPELGFAVGLSLLLTITLATALGFLIPYLLVRAGLDQAAGSDPILTTLKDVSGLLIYFVSIMFFLGHML